MEARLLCVGDMHLGRRPGCLPLELAERGLSPAELTPAAAWRLCVRAAIERKVDAVLLLGDVVDSERDFFEASGILERGVRELVEAGIEVCAVAGNHDIEVLPRLADQVQGFHLLGRRGEWEERVLERGGKPLVRLVGWSFPAARVHESPLARFALPRSPLPTLGMLHCDLEDRRSPYAPVALAELERAPVDAWLLGHLHVPSIRPGGRPIGYLGSLVGLDPTERGPHGPWLLRAGGARGIEIEHLAVAPLRWEALDVQASAIAGPEDLEAALAAALRDLHGRLGAQAASARAVGCRMRLVGRVRGHRELRRKLQEPLARAIQLDGTLYFVEGGVEDCAAEELDLETLGRESDPAGILARKLLVLRGPADSAERIELLAGARRALEQEANQGAWAALEPPRLDDERLAELLAQAGQTALEELLAQRAGTA
ncbi:MAG TPA: DNA repair exonuclease [Planctomycetota bacterium]|nr:DNA repair exonuclease [Planctomycetota bacterium]